MSALSLTTSGNARARSASRSISPNSFKPKAGNQSRKIQLRALAGLIFTLVVVVGVLVLPEPKEARADQTQFMIYIYNGDGYLTDEDLPQVDYAVYNGEDQLQAGQTEFSIAAFFHFNFPANPENPPQQWTHWQVLIDGEGVIFINPDTNPVNIAYPSVYTEWQVALEP